MQLWYDYAAFSLLVQFSKCMFMQMLSTTPQVMQVTLFYLSIFSESIGKKQESWVHI